MRLAAFGLLLVLASCGGTHAVCTATSCNGCCDPDTNTCERGDTQLACGSSGNVCARCSAGQVCDNAFCIVRNSGAGGGSATAGGTGGSNGGGSATAGGSGGSGGGTATAGGSGGTGGGVGTSGGSETAGGSGTAGGGFATAGGTGGTGGGGGVPDSGFPPCDMQSCTSGCCDLLLGCAPNGSDSAFGMGFIVCGTHGDACQNCLGGCDGGFCF